VSKVWEEEWHDGPWGPNVIVGRDDVGVMTEPTYPGGGYLEGVHRERARLAAQAPAMARLLLQVYDHHHIVGLSDEIRDMLRAAGVLDDAPKTSEER
jgi:hypothetical protein